VRDEVDCAEITELEVFMLDFVFGTGVLFAVLKCFFVQMNFSLSSSRNFLEFVALEGFNLHSYELYNCSTIFFSSQIRKLEDFQKKNHFSV
jgi:hypothetical protein